VSRSFGFQYEKGASGTPHYQGEVQLLNPTRKPSKLFRVPDTEDEFLFLEVHWEPTRNPRAAREYCGKAEGRIDGPWRYGQNGQRGGGYTLAMEAKTLDEATTAIKKHHPRDWFNNGERIRSNLSKHFHQPKTGFVPRPIHTFKTPPEIITWWNGVVKGPQRDRYDLLVVQGDTKLGKTQLLRALGPHIYWKGMVKLDDLRRTDYQYIIIDDIEWQYIPDGIKKSVLLGTGDCIITDKYVKKLAVCADKPCVYVCNNPAKGFQMFYECDAYWANNTDVLLIKEKLY